MVARTVPWLLGGSADLAGSCLTTLKFEGAGEFLPPSSGWGTYAGRNFHFGIREHAMGSIMNGMALCKLRPFGSTFFVFSDYMKPPLRMAAIMGMPCIWVFTHDSISVGEDGPTHQPIEQLSALRSIPNLLDFRPCDANETLETWRHVMTLQDEPAAIVLSRQACPTLDRTKYSSADGLHRGAYIIAGKSEEEPDVILMAAGSEVGLMLEAHEGLTAEGVKVRSLSIPSFALFKQQTDDYIRNLLPDSCRARVSIEAGRRDQWAALVGLDGEHVGLISFGASGKEAAVRKDRGFTPKHVMEAARRSMEGQARSIASRASIRPQKRRKVSA
jgi:transketolase